MMDIVLHAGTKFALEQWLDARGLGESYQDTDPDSPTLGDWFYRHTDRTSTFLWWKHPSGKLEKTETAFYDGFYGCLRYLTVEDMENSIADWVRDNTAVSIIDGFNGVGGEGITLVAPEDIQAHLESIGAVGWMILGGMDWSDPQVWYLSPVMIGDQREFDEELYESLVDFNVWTPTLAPETWKLVDAGPPAIEPWVQPTGAQDAYNTGDEVTHDRPQEGGAIWVFRSNIDANTQEPSRDGTFDRWWEPLGAA